MSARFWQTVGAFYRLMNLSGDGKLTMNEVKQTLPIALQAVFRHAEDSANDDEYFSEMAAKQAKRLFAEAPVQRGYLTLQDFVSSYQTMLLKHMEEEVLFLDIRRSVSALIAWHSRRNAARHAALDQVLTNLWPSLRTTEEQPRDEGYPLSSSCPESKSTSQDATASASASTSTTSTPSSTAAGNDVKSDDTKTPHHDSHLAVPVPSSSSAVTTVTTATDESSNGVASATASPLKLAPSPAQIARDLSTHRADPRSMAYQHLGNLTGEGHMLAPIMALESALTTELAPSPTSPSLPTVSPSSSSSASSSASSTSPSSSTPSSSTTTTLSPQDLVSRIDPLALASAEPAPCANSAPLTVPNADILYSLSAKHAGGFSLAQRMEALEILFNPVIWAPKGREIGSTPSEVVKKLLSLPSSSSSSSSSSSASSTAAAEGAGEDRVISASALAKALSTAQDLGVSKADIDKHARLAALFLQTGEKPVLPAHPPSSSSSGFSSLTGPASTGLGSGLGAGTTHGAGGRTRFVPNFNVSPSSSTGLPPMPPSGYSVATGGSSSTSVAARPPAVPSSRAVTSSSSSSSSRQLPPASASTSTNASPSTNGHSSGTNNSTNQQADGA